MTKVAPKLTRKERFFLSLIYPTGTIAVGTKVGEKLFVRGFLTIKFGRYGITPEGAAAICEYPESLSPIGGA
jgi:hypothetical protein